MVVYIVNEGRFSWAFRRDDNKTRRLTVRLEVEGNGTMQLVRLQIAG